MKEALYWKQANGKILCLLCPQSCIIQEGCLGFCRVRKNIEQKLYSANYGLIASIGMDPIEKKPLYHFYPGTQILSCGSVGCNLRCAFCQNWSISQEVSIPVKKISPEQLIEIAKRSDSIGIAYTYNEPLVGFEFVLETAKLAKKQGLKNVLVTNGYINEDPLKEILGFIDAANIDIKAFDEEFYKKNCSGTLQPVLKTIKTMHRHCHIELTNLIIPTLNDSEEKINELVDWVAKLDRNIPLHFSSYFPSYKMELPDTNPEILKSARKIALKKLEYVYTGNITDPEGSTTFCPSCKKAVISRNGYIVKENNLKDGKCGFCGGKIDVVE